MTGSPLDITNSKKRGKELVAEVIKTVADTQAFILTPLPDTILMSEDQYMSLVPYEEYMQDMSDYSVFTNEMKASKNKLFYTPHNVMEVRVKGHEHVA